MTADDIVAAGDHNVLGTGVGYCHWLILPGLPGSAVISIDRVLESQYAQAYGWNQPSVPEAPGWQRLEIVGGKDLFILDTRSVEYLGDCPFQGGQVVQKIGPACWGRVAHRRRRDRGASPGGNA